MKIKQERQIHDCIEYIYKLKDIHESRELPVRKIINVKYTINSILTLIDDQQLRKRIYIKDSTESFSRNWGAICGENNSMLFKPPYAYIINNIQFKLVGRYTNQVLERGKL